MAPPLPVTPSPVLSVELSYGIGGTSRVLNRLFFEYSGTAPSPTVCAAIATSVGAQWAAHAAALMNSGYALEEVTVTDVSVAGFPSGSDSTIRAGTRTGAIVPLSTAFVAEYQVGRKYRGGKPRSFLPYGVDGDLAANNAWSSSFQTAVTSGWNAFITAVVAITSSGTNLGDQVNVSYFSGFTNVSYGTPTKYRRVPTPRTVPVLDIITSRVYPTQIGTVRRRARL